MSCSSWNPLDSLHGLTKTDYPARSPKTGRYISPPL
jgi:hypothetical protein